MSLSKHNISETNYFKQFIQDCSKEAWEKYLDTIDNEINFIKEWERVSQELQRIEK